MVPSFRLRDIDRSKVGLKPVSFHLEQVQRFKDAQKELEKRCAELGIEVPVMVC